MSKKKVTSNERLQCPPIRSLKFLIAQYYAHKKKELFMEEKYKKNVNRGQSEMEMKFVD